MNTLVLLPGMDGTGRLFADFIAALGPDYDAVVVQYPPNRCLTYSELGDIARSRLPSNRPFILVAESFSGPIAISLAASNPPGLRGLVLCCSFARNPRPLIGWLGLFLALLPLNSLAFLVLEKFLLGNFSSVRTLSALKDSIALVPVETLRARTKAVLVTDVSSEMSQLSIPTLYLRASSDWLVPRSAAEHIQNLSPNVRVVTLEGPHLLLQAQPSEAAATVKNFLREISESPVDSASAEALPRE